MFTLAGGTLLLAMLLISLLRRLCRRRRTPCRPERQRDEEVPHNVGVCAAAPIFNEACALGCHFGTLGAGVHVGPACDYFCNFILNSDYFPFSKQSGAPAEVGTNTAIAHGLGGDDEILEHNDLKSEFVKALCYLLPRQAVKLIYGRPQRKGASSLVVRGRRPR